MTPEQYAAAQERYAKYRSGPKYAAVQERFKATGRRTANAIRHRAKLKVERPEAIEAWYAVQRAVTKGDLKKADRCEVCGRSLYIVAHHPRGYAPEHRLDVTWLCRPCHRAAHRKGVVLW